MLGWLKALVLLITLLSYSLYSLADSAEANAKLNINMPIDPPNKKLLFDLKDFESSLKNNNLVKNSQDKKSNEYLDAILLLPAAILKGYAEEPHKNDRKSSFERMVKDKDF